jgi:hypothetical protein
VTRGVLIYVQFLADGLPSAVLMHSGWEMAGSPAQFVFCSLSLDVLYPATAACRIDSSSSSNSFNRGGNASLQTARYIGRPPCSQATGCSGLQQLGVHPSSAVVAPSFQFSSQRFSCCWRPSLGKEVCRMSGVPCSYHCWCQVTLGRSQSCVMCCVFNEHIPPYHIIVPAKLGSYFCSDVIDPTGGVTVCGLTVCADKCTDAVRI